MSELKLLQSRLRSQANPAKARTFAGFFKTAPGEYGHGDKFLGLTVPTQRKIAKQFYHLALADLQKLLHSDIHEERFTALVILVRQFEQGDKKTKTQIYNFYLKNAKRINNWDLVDTSAPRIVGAYLLNKPRAILYKLAASPNLWERRIAIISTFTFIRDNEFNDTLRIAGLFLTDKHDLIHKAVGWMLREVGKKSELALKRFLNEHVAAMPRTMLRYAIEKLSPAERKKYLSRPWTKIKFNAKT